MKRLYYFCAGVALGVAATRRTRRAKEAAAAALKAKLTPSAIAADVADAIAELGNAVGSFAADVRQGAANRRTAYRPMVDGATGSVVMVAPDRSGPYVVDQRALGGASRHDPEGPDARAGGAADAVDRAANRAVDPADRSFDRGVRRSA